MPGPIFAKHERDIEIPSITPTLGLLPSRYKVIKEPSKNNITKIKKKTPTLRNKSSSRTLSPILNLIIARGWITRINSHFRALKSNIIRTIFIPPVVDPAQPPANINSKRTKMDI